MVSLKSSSPFKKPEVLDLVYTDVCGPMKTRSLGGASYFVTFVDDHSRKLRFFSYEDKRSGSWIFQAFCGIGRDKRGKSRSVSTMIMMESIQDHLMLIAKSMK